MTGPELLGARRLREVLSEHNVFPRKSLGQNFVVDPNTIRKVVAYAGLTGGERVVEIGAGAGSLTLELARHAGSVVALEVDERLVPVLAETLHGVSNVDIVRADARGFNFEAVGASHVVANLPYNIAAGLVLDVLAEAPSIRSMTVMTQREVGERLAAAPRSPQYGTTSVLVAYWAEARVATQISRNAFFPIPNVDSVVVTIVRSERADRAAREMFYRVVKAAFAQRRKTLRNTLTKVAGSPAAAEARLHAAGVDPDARAEELSVREFEAVVRGFE